MRERESVYLHKSKNGETLRESLVGPKGKLSKNLTRVSRMINYLDLSILEKRQLFFYHLWHEEMSLKPIKEFIEIREDPIEFIVDPVLKNNHLTKAYEEFYGRLESLKRKGKGVKTTNVSPNSKGIGQARQFEEKMFEILPFRGVLTAEQIAEKTGYSKENVRRVFKVAIKRGLISKIDKKELAKRLKGIKQL